jgi:hypothetical protein
MPTAVEKQSQGPVLTITEILGKSRFSPSTSSMSRHAMLSQLSILASAVEAGGDHQAVGRDQSKVIGGGSLRRAAVVRTVLVAL